MIFVSFEGIPGHLLAEKRNNGQLGVESDLLPQCIKKVRLFSPTQEPTLCVSCYSFESHQNQPIW